MEFIEYTTRDRKAFITLNRPEKRNALNFEMIRDLKRAFEKAENDASVKVVILSAKGDAFCAGADLAYLQKMQNYSYEENLADSQHLKDLFEKIYTLDKVVIAQVQGNALAGGCGLVTVCDFSFTIPEAKFGYTEVKIGFIPAIVMFFLIRKVGEARARELLLSGDLISSRDALARGIISSVVDKSELESTVLSFADHLVETNSGEAMRLTKQMMADVQCKTNADALNFAAEMNAKARNTSECKSGIAAFLNKTKIKW